MGRAVESIACNLTLKLGNGFGRNAIGIHYLAIGKIRTVGGPMVVGLIVDVFALICRRSHNGSKVKGIGIIKYEGAHLFKWL